MFSLACGEKRQISIESDLDDDDDDDDETKNQSTVRKISIESDLDDRGFVIRARPTFTSYSSKAFKLQ